MNYTLKPLLRKCAVVFFYDILIYSPSLEAHIDNLCQVLQLLSDDQWKLKLSKCRFAHSSITYLGHVISVDGVVIDPSMISDVQPVPQDLKQLRSFLGLAGYYRKFVHGFGTIAAPLTALLKEGFIWSDAAAAAFAALKKAVTIAPVLALPDFSLPFIVECDASTHGFGAVLLQEQHPIAFFSRPAAPRHHSLAAYERELIDLGSPSATGAPTSGAGRS